MDKPLISVIVGMYKGEKYITDAINSILNQDYDNLEIVLVDDGSPDKCGLIADKYAKNDSRIKVIHKENSGVSASRNVALQQCTGEYVCIMDQDDILEPDYISYLYELISSYDCEISATPSVNKFFGKLREHKAEEKDYVTSITGKEAATQMLYHKFVIAPWNKMISMELINRNDIKFDERFFNGEGFAFSIECFQQASSVALGHRKIYNYRVGDPESGASKFNLATINSSIEAQKYIKSVLINPSDEMMKAWEFSNWHTHCDCLNIIVGCGVEKEYRNLYESVKDVCHRQALCALTAPISLQQKVRGVLFYMNPYLASRTINKFRYRKFERGGGYNVVSFSCPPIVCRRAA